MKFQKNQIIITGTSLLIFIFIILAVLFQNRNKENIQSDVLFEELVVYTWTGDHYYRLMAELFEEQYQIPVRIVVTNSDVYIRKSISESTSPLGSIDCLIINSSYQLQQLIEAEVLPVSGGFVPLYSTKTGFLYDSAILENPPESWEDFNEWISLNPESFGFTAVGGEAGFSFIFSVLTTLLDEESPGNQNMAEWDIVWDWFRSNRDSMLFTSSDYDTLRLLSSGKLQLASGSEHQMLDALKSGELLPSVKMYVPDFGSLSEVYGIAVPGNAPNSNNASLFIQYLTSQDSIDIMEKMLSVRAINRSHTEDFLSLPDAGFYKSIVDSFKDKVLYY